MTPHPLELHPLHKVSQDAWNAIKQEQQPEYNSLPVEYRSQLLEHAGNVEAGQFAEGEGPLVEFEKKVYDLLNAPLEPEVKEELVEEAQEEAQVDPTPEESPVQTEDKAPPLEPKGPLPEDFPAREKLYQADVKTYFQLSKVDDLTSIDGIGPAIAKKIEKRVVADRKALNK